VVAFAACGSDRPSSAPITRPGTVATVTASTVAPAGASDAGATGATATVPSSPTSAGATATSAGAAATVASAAGGTEPAWADRFGRATVTMAGRTLRVVVASTEAQRVQGLRQVSSLAPFDGMLFVFDRSGRVSFTMADTLIPLSIGFYDATGQPVGQLDMVPCPGTDSTCPLYDVGKEFRYALEAPLGQLPPGAVQI
jgi:uncharacterized membrane protein (UPF0127 family)